MSCCNVWGEHSLRKSIFFLDSKFTGLKKGSSKRRGNFSVSQGFFILRVYTSWPRTLWTHGLLFCLKLTCFLKNGSQFFFGIRDCSSIFKTFFKFSKVPRDPGSQDRTFLRPCIIVHLLLVGLSTIVAWWRRNSTDTTVDAGRCHPDYDPEVQVLVQGPEDHHLEERGKTHVAFISGSQSFEWLVE